MPHSDDGTFLPGHWIVGTRLLRDEIRCLNNNWAMDVHSCEVNWAPLSNDMSTRIPKCEIQ